MFAVLLCLLHLSSLACAPFPAGEHWYQWEPDPASTAYLAFRIRDPKMTKRINQMHEIAVNVSKEFTPFLVAPDQLVQPLISFYLEEDELSRAAEIYDSKLRTALCKHLPRRIPYTEYELFNGIEYQTAVKAIPETDGWIKSVKDALQQALNRQGFINPRELDEWMIVATEPEGVQVIRRTIEIFRRLNWPQATFKLAASAYVDRLYICRGTPPNQYSAAPCDVIFESPVIQCEVDECLESEEKPVKEQSTTIAPAASNGSTPITKSYEATKATERPKKPVGMQSTTAYSITTRSAKDSSTLKALLTMKTPADPKRI